MLKMHLASFAVHITLIRRIIKNEPEGPLFMQIFRLVYDSNLY